MSEMIGLLGTLSALLTLAGSYRFASYFFRRGPELAILFAMTYTAIYLTFFEVITLLMGLATIVAPVAGVIYWAGIPNTSGLGGLSNLISNLGGGSNSTGSGGSGNSGGASGGGSGNDTARTGGSSGNSVGTPGNVAANECVNCGKDNPEDKSFCENCGWRLDA